MRRIFKLSLACLAVGAASGCKTAELVHPTGFQPYAGVRFINAVPDSSGVFGMNFHFVDIVENNFQYHMTFRNVPSSGAPFTSTATEYKGSLQGSRHFRLFLDDTIQAVASTILDDTTVTLVAGHNYTSIAWGAGRAAAPNNMHFSFWEDAVTDPGTFVALRALNTTNAAVDVRVYRSPSNSSAATLLAAAQAAPITWTVPAFSASAFTNTFLPDTGTQRYWYDVVPAGAAVTAATMLFADAITLPGAPANCDGNPCSSVLQHADIDATPGTTVAGSAVTGVIFPKVTLAEPNPGAPVAALSPVAGNVDNGPHVYRVTFVTGAGETALGTSSAAVTVVNKAVAGQVLLTNIPIGSALVLKRNIYRVTGVGAQLLTTIADNTTTTFTDNVADASLGAALNPGLGNTTIRTPQAAAFTAGPAITFMWDRRPPRTCDPYC